MARSIRIEYPGAFYHVMARGNLRSRIFFDDEDRQWFLEALGKACVMTGWRVHAWVLLSNHYHLAVETPEANLSKGMQWLQNSLTRRFNVRHRRWGRVFGDRYKAIITEGHHGYYYQSLVDYLHLNPVRARIVRIDNGQSVLDYPWSSVAAGFALPPGRRPAWLAADSVFAEFGYADTVAGRRGFVERLDRRAVEEGVARAGLPLLDADVDRRCSHLRRGWYWGRQAFATRVLDLAKEALERPKGRAYRSAQARCWHDEAQAARWLGEGLAAAGLSKKDLAKLKGSDPRKVALAKWLWENHTVSQSWLAERLQMKSAANVSQQIRRVQLRGDVLPHELKSFLNSVNI